MSMNNIRTNINFVYCTIRKYFAIICYVFLLIAAIGTLYKNTPYRWLAYYANSDPRYALVVSQAIIEHGNIHLDSYVSEGYNRNDVLKRNNHIYYYFPLGSSLLALPAICIGNILCYDMTSDSDNFHLQFLLALFSAVIVAVGMYHIIRTYVSPLVGLIIVSSLLFGSPLIVTLLTAYWSHNAGLVCVVLAWIMHLHAGKRAKPTQLYVLEFAAGLMAGLAYVSRPTLLLFCVVLVALALRETWRRALVVCVGIGTFMAIFVTFSLVEYGLLLPPYYASSRLAGSAINVVAALCGNLVSPSRGILIHAPLVGVILCASVICLWHRKLSALGLACLLWYGVHLFAISRFPHWWAGWSYGARLQTDVMPAIMMLAAEIYRCTNSHSIKQPVIIALIAVCIIWGVWVHSWQGVLNPNTAKWCKVVDVDNNPHMIWNWKHPQITASATSLASMKANPEMQK